MLGASPQRQARAPSEAPFSPPALATDRRAAYVDGRDDLPRMLIGPVVDRNLSTDDLTRADHLGRPRAARTDDARSASLAPETTRGAHDALPRPGQAQPPQPAKLEIAARPPAANWLRPPRCETRSATATAGTSSQPSRFLLVRHDNAAHPRRPTRSQCQAKQPRRLDRGRRCAWAIGAARDSGVGAVRRDLGTSMDARADCCMDQGASTEAASTRCAVLARDMSLAKSGSDRHVRSCLRGYSRVTALASASMPDSRAVQGTGRLGCSPNGNGAGHG